MKAQIHEPVPRYRKWNGPAIFSQGFRPFFLLAGMWGAVILPLSVEMVLGHIPTPTGIDPMAWHGHEMLFGFVAAVIAGFLLTAIPNWTGRLPLSGLPLVGLVALWGVGRVAMAFSSQIGITWTAVLDASFLVGLFAVTVREIVRGRNWRNVPVISIVGLLVIANVLIHAEIAGLLAWNGAGQRMAIASILMLIVLIGGRVVPSFTRNWLMKAGAARLPAGVGQYDRFVLIITVVVLTTWVVMPTGSFTAFLLGVAAILNAMRLIRWRGWTTYREPLVWVLHVGYLWIPVGLASLAVSEVWSGLEQGDALHALTAGAMGTMTLAMMSRATLGHTGQALHAGRGLANAYLLVVASALCRLTAPMWGDAYGVALTAAMVAWTAGFALFVVLFAPFLLRRRKP